MTTVKRSDSAAPDAGPAARRLLATALQATVPTTASPIEPPTCCPTLTRLDAAPASLVFHRGRVLVGGEVERLPGVVEAWLAEHPDHEQVDEAAGNG